MSMNVARAVLRLTVTLLVATVLATPTSAVASRPATVTEAASVSSAYAATAECSTVRISTVNSAFARWDYREPYPPACPQDRGNGFGLAVLDPDTGKWLDLYQASDNSVLCSSIDGISAAIGVDLKVCRKPPVYKQKPCAAVRNPYPGTRYEDVSLSRITAAGVKCSTARTVARGAHRKALGLAVPEDGVRRFSWNGWSVTADLRPSSDRYTATRNGRTVRWRF